MNRELTTLNERWRQKADLFRQHGHEDTARTLEVCSAELEAALRGTEEELLDLQEAARESGYSSDHLGRLVRDGKIPNSGRAQRAQNQAKQPAEKAGGGRSACARAG